MRKVSPCHDVIMVHVCVIGYSDVQLTVETCGVMNKAAGAFAKRFLWSLLVQVLYYYASLQDQPTFNKCQDVIVKKPTYTVKTSAWVLTKFPCVAGDLELHNSKLNFYLATSNLVRWGASGESSRRGMTLLTAISNIRRWFNSTIHTKRYFEKYS